MSWKDVSKHQDELSRNAPYQAGFIPKLHCELLFRKRGILSGIINTNVIIRVLLHHAETCIYPAMPHHLGQKDCPNI